MIIKASLRPPSQNGSVKNYKNMQIELKERLNNKNKEEDEEEKDKIAKKRKEEEEKQQQQATNSRSKPFIPRLSLPASPSKNPPPRPPRSSRSAESSSQQQQPQSPRQQQQAHQPQSPQQQSHFFTRQVKGLFDEEIDPDEEEEGVFCLSYYETKKLYDMGVVKQQPSMKSSFTEDNMRKEVQREYQYIAKGIFFLFVFLFLFVFFNFKILVTKIS